MSPAPGKVRSWSKSGCSQGPPKVPCQVGGVSGRCLTQGGAVRQVSVTAHLHSHIPPPAGGERPAFIGLFLPHSTEDTGKTEVPLQEGARSRTVGAPSGSGYSLWDIHFTEKKDWVAWNHSHLSQAARRTWGVSRSPAPSLCSKTVSELQDLMP